MENGLNPTQNGTCTNLQVLSNLFYSGKYVEILDHLGRSPISNEDISHFQIGSLAFLGETVEASLLYTQSIQGNQTSQLYQFRCRFFLGISNVRKSEYKKALHYFVQNKLISKKLKKISLEEMFYAHQGSAFYRFFHGKYSKAKQLSEAAYKIAFNAKFKFGQILSLDLLGHSLCQIGSIRRGLFEIERALALSLDIGNGGISTALHISLIKLRAFYGVDLANTLSNLENALREMKTQDTYSQAELYLEYARQLILRGMGRKAQQQLELAGSIIYKFQNNRQSSIYNLRFANLLFLRGDYHAALSLVMAHKARLNSKMDITILNQSKGLEEKIAFHLGIDPQSSPQLLVDSSSRSYIDQRICLRKGIKINDFLRLQGEDTMGDILDEVKKEGIHTLDKIKALNLWGLIPQIFQLPPGYKGLVLGPIRNDLFIIDGPDIIYRHKGITEPIKKMFQLLSGFDYRSKEFLVQNTWNYHYSPDPHDRLLYATIGKMRSLLEPYSNWLEWSQVGYRFGVSVKCFSNSSSTVLSPFSPILPYYTTPLRSSFERADYATEKRALNLRQLKTIKLLQKGKFIGVSEYSLLFKVSKMTACRDLSTIHQSGIVVRVGNGRNTLYGLKEFK